MADKIDRRAPRDKHNSAVEIYAEEGNAILDVGRLVNFSKVGVCFTSTKTFRVGSRLRMRIRLVREGRLYVWGRVVWVKKGTNTIRYGVEFEKVHDVA